MAGIGKYKGKGEFKMKSPFTMKGYSPYTGSSFKMKKYNSPAYQKETATEQTTDEGRAAYLAEKGVTSSELSKELNRLAKLHPQGDDIDYGQWKSVVDSLSTAKQPE